MDDMDILRYMVTIEGIVEHNGWAVQGVFPTEGDSGCRSPKSPVLLPGAR